MTSSLQQSRELFQPEVRVRRVRLPHAWVDDPSYKTPGSAGMDLYATAQVMIYPGKTQIIPTGIQMAIPQGYEGQIRPRSGLAAMHQITVLNTPGTIDSDYRGEVAVILINHGIIRRIINRGDRIAQIVFAPVVRATLYHVTTLDETTRGEGGFGSTGT